MSADGRWFFIGGHGSQAVIRLSRGQVPVQKAEVSVGFQVDNVRWASDGSLLAAGQAVDGQGTIFECALEGQCAGVTARVAKVDPNNLTAEELVRYPSNEHVILGTGAIQIGNEIWLGGAGGGDRIARFRVP